MATAAPTAMIEAALRNFDRFMTFPPSETYSFWFSRPEVTPLAR
jgi:hypothetical protein